MFTTFVGSTLSGADVRLDVVPCNEILRDGSLCKIKYRIYLKYSAFGRVEFRCVWLCSHYIESLQIEHADDLLFQTPALVVSVVDCIHKHSNLDIPKTQVWQRIHADLCERWPDVKFKENFKKETRPGKGKIKDYSCSAKRYYERLQTHECGNVFDPVSQRVDADKTINRIGTSIARESVSVLDYDSACACSHLRGEHKSNGFCLICNKFCEEYFND